MAGSNDPLASPSRIRTLQNVMAVTADKSTELDHMAAEAASVLNVPIAMITFVDVDGQTFRGEHGLPETLAMIRHMPISYSIFEYTVRNPVPLVIPDMETHPTMINHPAVVEMGIRAYLGIPLKVSGAQVVGALSFVDYVRRHWSEVRPRGGKCAIGKD